MPLTCTQYWRVTGEPGRPPRWLIRTFGNNQLLFNGNNGAFTGSVRLQ
jgi:hypothetical protein